MNLLGSLLVSAAQSIMFMQLAALIIAGCVCRCDSSTIVIWHSCTSRKMHLCLHFYEACYECRIVSEHLLIECVDRRFIRNHWPSVLQRSLEASRTPIVILAALVEQLLQTRKPDWLLPE